MIIPSGRRVRPAIPDVRKRKEGFIAATLKVLDGAFRLTTDAAVKHRTTRDITVQFPTVTAGICGTDIWGKNLGDKEVVVLIEGKITVNRRGDPLASSFIACASPAFPPSSKPMRWAFV